MCAQARCVEAALQEGTLRYADGASVKVRLLDAQRVGHLPLPATDRAVAGRLHVPEFTSEKVRSSMRREPRRGRPYSKLKPRRDTEEQWVQKAQEVVSKATGVKAPAPPPSGAAHAADASADGNGDSGASAGVSRRGVTADGLAGNNHEA